MLGRALRIFFTGSAFAAIAACSASSNIGPSLVLTSVVLTPTSLSVPVGGTITMVATPKDQNGASMSGLPGATFSSSDTTKATVGSSSGVVTGVAVGSSTITATIVSGSISKSATQVVTVTAPSSSATVIARATIMFDPSAVTVTAGSGTATVTWTFQNVTHNVTFDTIPAGAMGPSNIPNSTSTDVSRDFTTHGTYFYHCTIHGPGMSGKVTVN